ncbi:hypothetical protein [Kitasatospora sp. HPMI-4]|uniref:hypothetical protein n=1 Tax=Kitasatospora sp. HPMI-4 TaxID=3448443 RepID=UPI003F1B8991
MPRPLRATVLVLAVTALAGCGSSTVPGQPLPSRSAGARPCPTWAQQQHGQPTAPPTAFDGTPANTPEATELSQAVGTQGRGAFADVWGTQITDYPAGRVALCVTDLSRGQALAAAAKKADPKIDLDRLDLYPCRYSQRTLDGAIRRIVALGPTVLGFPLHTYSPVADASGVQVTTTAQGAASQALHERLARAAGDGIPVLLQQSGPAVPA